MLTNVERLDQNPSYVVRDLRTNRLVAIHKDRPTLLARELREAPEELRVVLVNGERRFIVPRQEKSPRRGTNPLPLGAAIFVALDDVAFKARVVTKNGDAAHAVRIDPACATLFESVVFHPTLLDPFLWDEAGYTAIVWQGARSYATTAPFSARELGATFARQFDKGSFEVIDVKRRLLHAFDHVGIAVDMQFC